MAKRIDRWIGCSMMEDFHTDLISVILIKLDVKTLSMCRRVCKTWNTVISSRGFIAAHRRQSISRGLSNLLFIHLGRKLDWQQQWCWAFTMINPESHRSSSTIYIDSIAESGILRLCLPITCDLLCFVTYGGLELCNPMTGRVHTLPKPPYHPTFRPFDVVFGYVASRRQYVLVTLFYSQKKKRASKLCVDVSSPLSSSSWKAIAEDCPLGRIPVPGTGNLINRCVYWLDSPKNRIVALDLDTDKFKIISCPDRPQYVTLIDLKGTLSLAVVRDGIIRSNCPKFKTCIDIWVFYDQFKPRKWVKNYSIAMDPVSLYLRKQPYISPKSSSEGELIVSSAISGKHYVWNLEKRSIRTFINLSPAALIGSEIQVGFFWESFFSF